MGIEELTTRQLIIDAAKKEFLEKGYTNASLRNIAKNANVTTGAFYGCFKGKEDLFSTIVLPCCAAVKCRFALAKDGFFVLHDDISENTIDCIDWMIDYIYSHYDVFKLLICSSDGTKFESFVHDMVEIEVDSTINYLINQGQNIDTNDKQLYHMIVSGMFGSIFELIEHDIPIDKAKVFVEKLRRFNHAGWLEITAVE